jgi:hypothetical protein
VVEEELNNELEKKKLLSYVNKIKTLKENLINKPNKKLLGKYRFSIILQDDREIFNKLKEESSLKTSKKILQERLRGKYKDLNNAFQITKSLPTLTINDETPKEMPLQILKKNAKAKITKSLPILKLDNAIITTHSLPTINQSLLENSKNTSNQHK